MLLTMLKGKIHGARVTRCDLHYGGSISVDAAWLDQAGIWPHEQVHVFNVTNGQRLVTYAIAAPRGSCEVALNGAAARLTCPGDTVIIVAYGQMSEAEARAHQPLVFFPPEADSETLNLLLRGETAGSGGRPLRDLPDHRAEGQPLADA